MKSTTKNVKNELTKLEKKYESLVWFARKSPEQIKTIEGVRNAAIKVMEMYPDECEALISPHSGDWQHGFNSGMLAAARLMQDLLNMSSDEAYENFPNLMS